MCLQSEEGEPYFGRNYDGEECQAILVHTRPEKGYESISTCCLDYLGFGEDYHPLDSWMDRMQTLAAIYVPLDGINEKGLVVADLLAGDGEETHQETGKVALTTTTAIRLLLDRAADVEEALALLEEYDMHSSIHWSHHLSIADQSGRSVVVEYVEGERLVTPAQVVTNHYLSACEKQGLGSEESHLRYDTLLSWEGDLGPEGVRERLEAVAQKNVSQGGYEKTMWSLVYAPRQIWADFYFNEIYDHSYHLTLGEKGGFVRMDRGREEGSK